MKEISEAVLAFSTFVKGYCQSFLTPGNGFLIQVLLYTCTGPLKKSTCTSISILQILTLVMSCNVSNQSKFTRLETEYKRQTGEKL